MINQIFEIDDSRFPLGRLVATTNVLTWANQEGVELAPLLVRHASADWGDMVPEDRAQNDSALANDDGRLLSAYETDAGRVWIITEWDRSVTTILKPEDY